MKTCKKLLIIFTALSMLLALCACGGADKKDNNQTEATGNAGGTQIEYSVTVLDGQGAPMTGGVVVKFLKDGQQIAMQKTDANGVATKALDKGDYTVELMFTDSNLSGHYDVNAAVLSVDKPTLTLSLINELGASSIELFADGENHTAYDVTTGSTYVSVAKDVRNYFIFTPTQGGTYEFRVDNNDLLIGYYGAPHFVQTLSAVDPVDNVITLSVSAGSIGGAYVIGLDGVKDDTKAVLSIIRTGDPTITISDMPWTEYKTTHTPAPYTLTLADGQSLKYVDITGTPEDAVVVYSDADGYYHYGDADGPIVLVHLGQKAPYVSLQTVIQGDGLGGGAPIRAYFYDADGNFLKKEDYTDILTTYFENMDETFGVYPLTKDLEYIIKNGCNGWWDESSPDFIFDDCNPEIGWMFALCYVVG